MSQNKLEEALAELGNTEEEVVAKLGKLGCTGNLQDWYSCPIANYLKTYGFDDPAVEPEQITADWKSAVSQTVIPTSHIKFFIIHFDEAKYPELIRPEDK